LGAAYRERGTDFVVGAAMTSDVIKLI
jgi:hypothetical protein